MADVKVGGLEDLKKAVEELTGDLAKRVVRGALRDAAKPVMQAAKRTTAFKDVTGRLRKNIAVVNSKVYTGRNNNGLIGVYVSVRKYKGIATTTRTGRRVRVKSSNSPKDAFYFKFLELGTKKMRAREFLEPAADAKFPESIEIFKTAIRARINKANHRK